jgi:hypothetical protein
LAEVAMFRQGVIARNHEKYCLGDDVLTSFARNGGGTGLEYENEGKAFYKKDV